MVRSFSRPENMTAARRVPSLTSDVIALYMRGEMHVLSTFSHLFLAYVYTHESEAGHGPPLNEPLRQPPKISKSSGEIMVLLA